MLKSAVLAVVLALVASAPISLSVHRHLHHAVSASPGNATMPAGGDVWPVGIYWVPVSVGTPPVEFPVAIDSGSGDLDIEGVCSACVHNAPNKEFDPTQSSTSAKAFPFTFSNTYETCDLNDMTAPCTIKGALYKDTVTLGGLGPVTVTFGAITDITKNFDQFHNICGVMGFAGNSSSTVFSQLVAGGHVDEDVWALCVAAGSKSNGTLTLGGIDDRLYDGEISWVKDVGAQYGYYGVNAVGGITVAGVEDPLDGSKSDIILDSGTNILLFPNNVFTSLATALETLCQTSVLPGVCGPLVTSKNLLEGECFHLTDEDVAKFPTLSFHLDGVTLTLPPSKLLVKGDVRAVAQGDPSLTCLAVRNTGESLFIIGDTLMSESYLIFDRQRQRIGWAPVSDSCGNV